MAPREMISWGEPWDSAVWHVKTCSHDWATELRALGLPRDTGAALNMTWEMQKSVHI